jgi:SAM-dependent methyltransferase
MRLDQGLIERTLDFDARNFLLDTLPKNAVGMEIGVHKGAFTRRILERTQPSLLYLVDPWKYESSSQYKNSWYGGWLGGSQAHMDKRCEAVKQRFADGFSRGAIKMLRAYSSDAFATLPDDHLDWVYIDGNHLYEFVKADLEHALRCVRPGGLITGDDYGEGGWWQGGVKRAVDEFVRTREGVELVVIKKCQFILKKR